MIELTQSNNHHEIRDAIRDFFAAPDGVDDDSTDEIIEEAIEDPDELLDEA